MLALRVMLIAATHSLGKKCFIGMKTRELSGLRYFTEFINKQAEYGVGNLSLTNVLAYSFIYSFICSFICSLFIYLL